MRMPPLSITRVITAHPTGKHYRVVARAVPCGTAECPTRGLHVHIACAFIDPLPITHRGMVTWPTRRRRRRRS